MKTYPIFSMLRTGQGSTTFSILAIQVLTVLFNNSTISSMLIEGVLISVIIVNILFGFTQFFGLRSVTVVVLKFTIHGFGWLPKVFHRDVFVIKTMQLKALFHFLNSNSMPHSFFKSMQLRLLQLQGCW